MNWQQTRILFSCVVFNNMDMDAQAEASFKAGIREVVEWIQANDINWGLDIEVPWDSWEAKLKEWGIEGIG